MKNSNKTITTTKMCNNLMYGKKCKINYSQKIKKILTKNLLNKKPKRHCK